MVSGVAHASISVVLINPFYSYNLSLVDTIKETLDSLIDGIRATTLVDKVRAIAAVIRVQNTLLLVVGNKGSSHVVISVKTLADSLGLVVITLDEGLAGDIVLALDSRRVVVISIDATRARVGPTTGDTSDDVLVRNDKVESEVNLDVLVELVSLGLGTGETIEEDVTAGVGLNLVQDHADDNGIRDETTSVHVLGSLLTELGLSANLSAEEVTGGDVVVVIVLDELLGDGTLATARRACRREYSEKI